MKLASDALKYPFEYYQPTAIRLSKIMSDQEAREEYSRLRSIAVKRLRRLGETEFKNTQTYVNNIGQFPTLKDIGSMSELAAKLNEVARFISSERSTVTGQRRIMSQTLKSLRSHGIDINAGEYLDFMQFMDAWREVDKQNKYHDSERVMELYYQARRLNINPYTLLRDFETWYNNSDKLEDFERGNTSRQISAETVRKQLGIYKTRMSKNEREEREEILADLRYKYRK